MRAVDPDAARERRLADENDRHIEVSALPGGAAKISGQVAAAAAAAFDQRLSELASGVCAADPRTIAARRADALAAMADGRALVCSCDDADCSARAADSPVPGGARVVVNVVASEDTVCGTSRRPGYLSGFGVIDGDQIRELVDAGRRCACWSPQSHWQKRCAISRRRRWSAGSAAEI